MKKKMAIIVLGMSLCLNASAQPFASGYVTQQQPMKPMIPKGMQIEGQKFKDFTAKGLDKKVHKLSNYVGKGKYVLIDFWASWCRPCMNEMSNVKACYDKYKKKGFSVVGCSLDERDADWRKAIKSAGMYWPQLCDFGGFNGAASTTYKLEYIPFSVLCDGRGKIVAVGLTGEALQEKLYEIYGF